MEKSTRDLLRETLPPTLEAWPDAIAAMPSGDAWWVVSELHRAWIEGALRADFFPDEASPAIDRRIGRMFQRLPEALVGALYVDLLASDETSARRWCWAPGWVLLSQDEDLILMCDELMVPLLEEVAAQCTKYDYVLEIVAHHARDAAHAALWKPDADVALAEVAERIGGFLPAARAAGASRLVGYLERLVGYATRRHVKLEEAEQRVFDLRRCYEDKERAPAVVRRDRSFIAPMHSGTGVPDDLVIDVDTGRMRIARRGPST
jgi:hypothetical protein